MTTCETGSGTSGNREWDAIVIGSGMGGKAAAAALSRLDHRALLVAQARKVFDQAPAMSFVPFPSPKDAVHDPGPSQKHTGELRVWADWAIFKKFK